jgi:hypothetical protein
LCKLLDNHFVTLPHTLSIQLTATVDRDAGEPGAQARFPTKSAKRFDGSHPRVLHDFLGLVNVPSDQPQRQLIKRGRMAMVKLAERRLIPSREKFAHKPPIREIGKVP